MGIGVAIEEGHYTLPRRVEKPRGCNGDASVTDGAVMAGLQEVCAINSSGHSAVSYNAVNCYTRRFIAADRQGKPP